MHQKPKVHRYLPLGNRLKTWDNIVNVLREKAREAALKVQKEMADILGKKKDYALTKIYSHKLYKRERNLREIALPFKIVQYFREKTRQTSIDVWKKKPNAVFHQKEMKKHLFMLRVSTKIYHLTRKK